MVNPLSQELFKGLANLFYGKSPSFNTSFAIAEVQSQIVTQTSITASCLPEPKITKDQLKKGFDLFVDKWKQYLARAEAIDLTNVEDIFSILTFFKADIEREGKEEGVEAVVARGPDWAKIVITTETAFEYCSLKVYTDGNVEAVGGPYTFNYILDLRYDYEPPGAKTKLSTLDQLEKVLDRMIDDWPDLAKFYNPASVDFTLD